MMIDCNGINIAPTIPKKIIGESRKVSFAKANPAKELTIKIIKIAPAHTIVELIN